MAINTDAVQRLYVAYFNRPSDPIGQAYWESKLPATAATQAQLTTLAAGFSGSAEYAALYAGQSNAQIVNNLYLNLFGRPAETAGLTSWALALTNGTQTFASIALQLTYSAQGTDATAIANKLSAANSFTNSLVTSAQITGYSGTAAAASARTWLATVTDVASTLTSATAAATLSAAVTAATAAGASTGTTFTLTTGVDNIVGTANNDTIIADNTGATKQLSAADQINGGSGTDTLKVYNAAADALDAQSFGVLSNVEAIYVNSGTLTTTKTVDLTATALTGLTSYEVDSPVAMVNGTSFNFKESAAQTVKLTNVNVATGGAATVNVTAASTVTSANVTVNGAGNDSTNNGTLTLDVTATGVTTLNLATATAADKLTLANTGGSLATLVVTGDQSLTLIESLAGLKTINASADTGAFTVDTSGVAKAATFAFTGGTANDKITFAAGDLALLTAGSQLDGGAGIDTLVIKDTTPLYTALNAAKNFEVLGLGVTATTVDASLLTSIKSFTFGGLANETINNLGAGSSETITGATTGTAAFGAAVGNTSTDITLGTTTAAGFITNALTTTGLTSVSLTSNGTSAETITTLNNSDNSTFTVKGAADLTITNAIAGTTTGSKVDGSAFTGKLSVIGSTKADTLIGGSGADTIQGAAAGTANQADTLTGGAGADKFVFTSATGAAFFAESAGTSAVTKITDFVAGVDKFDFITTGTAFTGATVANAQTIATAADLTGVYAGITAIAASTATNVSAAVITVSAGAAAGTYLYVNDIAGAGVSNTADMLINITGVSGTIVAGDFIFA